MFEKFLDMIRHRKATAPSPQQQVAELEYNALEMGISMKELDKIRSIGNCPKQIQQRIAKLNEWIAENQEDSAYATPETKTAQKHGREHELIGA